MCRKSTSIIVFVCLLALSNVALASQSNWQGSVNNNWSDPLNWDPNVVPTVGDRACIQGRSTMPVIVDTGAPGNVPDACCQSLEIIPWAWVSGQSEDTWLTFTINSGWVDANCTALNGASTQFALPGWGIMEGRLVVNDGLLTMHDDVPPYANENEPPGPGYGGRGLWIGGGSTTFLATAGHVIVNGGEIRTPKIAIYNGDITLNGGLLYDTNSVDVEFILRENWAGNKIYINGGTLKIAGNQTTKLNNLVKARRIIPHNTRGEFNGTYDSPADFNGYDTNLVATYKPGCAWQSSPEKYATMVSFRNGLNISWKAGDWIGEPNINEPNNGHYVFLGTDLAVVSAAGIGPAGTTASTVYRGKVNQPADDVNGDPNITLIEDTFALETTYYVRVDEVNDLNDVNNDPCHIKGMIWEFKTVGAKATNPVPADTGTGLKMPLQLAWTAGDWSPNEHRVFFGMDYATVNAANTSNAVFATIYRGTVASTAYPLGKLLEDRGAPVGPDWVLAPNTTYWWRIDEKSPTGNYDANSIKAIWSFNTGSSVSIEDFQQYNNDAELNDVWLEGVLVCKNKTWAGAGRVSLIREGASDKYMQFSYSNSSGGTPEDPRYLFSELDYQYNDANWTTGGVYSSPPKLLEIFYRGLAVNAADPTYDRMYVAIEDTVGDVNIVLNPNAEAQKTGTWTNWAIAYNQLGSGLAGQADLNHVSDLYIGFGSRCNNLVALGGDGNVMFDNIRVISSTCVTGDVDGDGQPENPVADFDGNCTVDVRDLDVLANDWLAADIDYDWTLTKQTPAAPILWYNFNEATGTICNDTGTGDANVYNGDIINPIGLNWDTDGGRGVSNGCIYLPPGQNSYVEIITGGRNPLYFQGNNNGMSCSIWEDADMTASWGWSGIFGAHNPTEESLEIHCPSPFTGGAAEYGPSCNFIKRNAPGTADDATASSGKRVYGDFGGRWNNWIFVKTDVPDVNGQHMLIYLNGIRVADTNSTTDADVAGPMVLPPVANFRIGIRGGNWGGWMGKLDDFKVWNYALNENEVHYIATDGTGILHVEVASVANIKLSAGPPPGSGFDAVNMGDLALMVDEWLTTKLWP